MSPPRAGERRVLVLGSTGSIGTQTLDVITHLNRLHEQGAWSERYRIVGLAAGRNHDVLARQAAATGCRDLALVEGDASAMPADARVRRGRDSAERLVREIDADVVLAAMVGFSGLPATLAAAELGRDIALANKETLVAAGSLVTAIAARSGSKLLPVDSEHAAVWQCLAAHDGGMALCPPCRCGPEVARAVLTASGGPFRTWTTRDTHDATPEQALKHPTWTMGPKVTIDSASLTNKAFEIIEARWLFGLPAERIGVLVHPQSVVHAMVEFADGSFVAHLSPPDMRSPIQYALTWPGRPDGASRRLSFEMLARLEFAEPDTDRFPAVRLAYDVIRRGGRAGAVFNGANEAAVEAFLARRIPFGRLSELAARAVDELGDGPLETLEDAIRADAESRRHVEAALV